MPVADPQPVSSAEARALFTPFVDHTVIVIAVSGGPDSVALLWLASRWRAARKNGPQLIAVTVDHGLRAESRGEAETVKRLAQRLGVMHRTVRWTGVKPVTGIQEAARHARYALLASEAKRAGAYHVLTAHTLDDQAETVLLRLLRGSGPAGLQAMAEVAPYPGDGGLTLARPLLAIPKARLIATLREAAIAYAEDSSNRDPKFTRPRLRQLMPLLAAEGLTAERLATLARRLQRAEGTLRRAVATAAERVTRPAAGEGEAGAGDIAFDRNLYLKLPAEIGLRLLGDALGRAGDEGPVELGKLEALFDALIAAGTDAPFRRSLAGALVTARGPDIVVSRAPARRTRAVRPSGRRIAALTTRKARPFSEAGTR